MSATHYFFDTYALVALAEGAQSYRIFTEEEVTTSILNIGELYYVGRGRWGESKAEETATKYSENTLELGLEDVLDGAKFRYEHKKLRLSYVDAIGYRSARKNGLVFLTGDRGFRGFPGVELVR